MTHVLFITAYCGPVVFSKIVKKSRTNPQVSSQTFNKSIIDGLRDNGCEVEILSYLPIPAFPRGRIRRIKGGNFNDEMGRAIIPFLNYQYVKQLSISIMTLVLLFKKLILAKKYREYLILCDYLYFPICFPAVLISKVFTIPALLIIPDIPDRIISYMGVDKAIRKNVVRLYLRSLNRITKYFSGFILFAEKMKRPLGLSSKPSIIIEGMYQCKPLPDEAIVVNNVILYTGGLYKEYGINDLIESLPYLCDKEIELWLCGDGTLVEEIIRKAAYEKRIKYLGLLSHDETLLAQRHARILVNPRPKDDWHTRYSFPSKTMEYLCSGRPVVMARPESMPQEYVGYFYEICNQTPEGIAREINNVILTPEEELEQRALAARKFVQTHKNPLVQCGRLLEFAKTIRNSHL